jgi:uncharacterized small protein (DUF1192 family)
LTGNIWIDLQLSLAEIEAEIPDIPDELSRVPFERDASKDAIDADFKRLQDDTGSDAYWRFRTP